MATVKRAVVTATAAVVLVGATFRYPRGSHSSSN